jgi:hypothetical protein
MLLKYVVMQIVYKTNNCMNLWSVFGFCCMYERSLDNQPSLSCAVINIQALICFHVGQSTQTGKVLIINYVL